MVALQDIQQAAEALDGVVRRTPILTAHVLSNNLLLKAENLQTTGSFKIRGAYNRVRLLTDEERGRGVVASSAGNHAQGVAKSASLFGVRSVVCMPATAPALKVSATRGYGAEVVLVPGSFDAAAARAAELSASEGLVYLHPFNDPAVIAGQGTVGLEILQQVPDVEQIVVPIGGGGLISGIATAVKSLRPEVTVIGVQPAKVPSMRASLAAGGVVTVPDASTVADGLHVLTPGDLTFDIVRRYVDDVVTVTEDQIACGITALMEIPKVVAEGAGACATAAFLAGLVDMSKKTVCVISGGNVDISALTSIIERGLIASGCQRTFRVCVPSSSKNPFEVVNRLVEAGCNIKDVHYYNDDTPRDINSVRLSVTVLAAGAERLAEAERIVAEFA